MSTSGDPGMQVRLIRLTLDWPQPSNRHCTSIIAC